MAFLFAFLLYVHGKQLGPVVQSIVSLTTSLRRQLVKYMPLNYQIHCYFLLEKCENLLHCKGFSLFSTNNNSVFVIFTFENLTKRSLTNDVVNFEQPAPEVILGRSVILTTSQASRL